MEISRWLQEWYTTQCDGEWEHGGGIRINSIDNPGWHVVIALDGLEVEYKQMDVVRVERTDDDWIYCKKQDGCFTGAGGPGNLEEILNIFYQWATSNT
ncbi:immunity 53 family protein [Paenibacillus sp. FSL H7-0350]|uniref:immunity 53 family protein n=1 Tax=Paenibacillus sp. FSL H7-0350 TaxID=2975345 RepID=UPI0031580123